MNYKIVALFFCALIAVSARAMKEEGCMTPDDEKAIALAAALQAVIDACANGRCGTVLVPAGEFRVGAIELKSDVMSHFVGEGVSQNIMISNCVIVDTFGSTIKMPAGMGLERIRLRHY